jgi:hypothetical protein
MELRWLVLCNENGVKTAPILQYLDNDGKWQDVDYVEMKTWEYEEERRNIR